MTITSTHGGIIRVSSSHYGNAFDPLDAATVRDVVHNNLSHYADSYGQVRIAWNDFSANGSTEVGKDMYATGRLAGEVADTYYTIWISQPFPILMRSSGEDVSSCKLRVALCGATSNASSTVSFAMVMHQPGATPSVGTGYNTMTATSSSTTAAWLTLTNAGLGSTSTLMWLDARRGGGFVPVSTPTIADVGGAAVGVQQQLVQITVLGSSPNTQHNARLHGLYVAEHGM